MRIQLILFSDSGPFPKLKPLEMSSLILYLSSGFLTFYFSSLPLIKAYNVDMKTH